MIADKVDAVTCGTDRRISNVLLPRCSDLNMIAEPQRDKTKTSWNAERLHKKYRALVLMATEMHATLSGGAE